MNKRDKVIAGAIVAMAMIIVILQLGMYAGRKAEAQAAQPSYLDQLKIRLTAAEYELEIEREKLSIIICESDYYKNGVIKHEGWGDGGKSYGIAQFQLATFRDLRAEAGRPELRWKNRDDQLWLLDWALRHGYGKYWTCYGKTDPSAPRSTPLNPPFARGDMGGERRLGGVKEAKR